jgi:hypothetical protein
MEEKSAPEIEMMILKLQSTSVKMSQIADALDRISQRDKVIKQQQYPFVTRILKKFIH